MTQLREHTGRPGKPTVGAGRLPGVDVLRAIGVLAVVYSHISYYVIDDRGEGWWLIDVVFRVVIDPLRLNQHLSFFGVALFMVLTGLLVTGSAIRHGPARFLTNRIGRLLPLYWIAVGAAIVLVWTGVNALFSRQETLSVRQALLSFAGVGYFLHPEVVVLGVAWTLFVQIAFYLCCVAARPVLRTRPALLPVAGAGLCVAVLAGTATVPDWGPSPMLAKLAATLPAVFVGQVLYFWRARTVGAVATAVGLAAQVAAMELATRMHVYWAGDHYLWTLVVVTVLTVLIAPRGGPLADGRIVRWLGTRSYPIYLVHTLILYRVYDRTVGLLGPTGAVALYLVVTALVAEAAYRWIEVPAGRWIGARSAALDRA